MNCEVSSQFKDKSTSSLESNSSLEYEIVTSCLTVELRYFRVEFLAESVGSFSQEQV